MKIVFTRSSMIYDESRATKEIFAFLEHGYDVFVLGWDRKGNAEQKCKELFEEYATCISFAFYKGATGEGFFQKICSRRNWNIWLLRELSRIKNIDVIHACDYDTGGAVRRFAKAEKIPYIYDIYDYYIDAHHVPFILRRLIEWDEIKTINEAYATIICTEERKKQIEKSSPKRLYVIHNSPDIDKHKKQIEEFDYVYCGVLNGGRLIKEILDLYEDKSKYKFVFAGRGIFENKTKDLDAQFDNFIFKGSIPYAEVLEIESKSKVISAIYEPSIRNHQLCAPNKFYEALALGKPLIVCRGTGIDRVVEENNIGRVINYNVEEFYIALQQLCLNEVLRNEMGERARVIYEQNFKWTLMKNRLIEIYSNMKLET